MLTVTQMVTSKQSARNKHSDGFSRRLQVTDIRISDVPIAHEVLDEDPRMAINHYARTDM